MCDLDNPHRIPASRRTQGCDAPKTFVQERRRLERCREKVPPEEETRSGLAKIMTEATPVPRVSSDVDTRYLAYCDILGFSARLLNDFDNTLQAYRDFSKQMSGP